MLRHAIVLVAVQVLFEAVKVSSALRLRDISNFIEHFNRNDPKYDIGDHRPQEDEDNNYVSFNSRDLDELINQVANEVRHVRKGSNKFRNSPNLSSDLQRGRKNPSKAVLSYLGNNNIDSGLNNGHILNNNDIYVILNPRTELNENDFKEIIGLLSRIILDSDGKRYPKQDDTRAREEHRYKGFAFVKNPTRRRNVRRESKELYSPRDSVEDFKPKRVRNEYGGAGGRTPIPYIRHHDIYERE